MVPSAMVMSTRPVSSFPSSHEFFDFERKLSASTRCLAARSSRTRFAERRRLPAAAPVRKSVPDRAHALEQGLERQRPGLDESRVEDGERGLEARDAVQASS